MILAVVALLSMTVSFAEGENMNEANNTNAYEMNISMYSLSHALNLNNDQREAVADVNKAFSAEMMNAAVADKADRKAMVDKAVRKNLSYMHYILDREQYHKYIIILNATLNNRGLNN